MAPLAAAIDVGNSSVALSLFEGDVPVGHWRLPSAGDFDAEALRRLLISLAAPRRPVAAAIASVVPAVGAIVAQVCREVLEVDPLLIHGGLDVGVRLLYERPADLGADRIANIAAAYGLYGGPCIVVDAGTATKFEAVTAEGRYLGGAIAPGIGISAEALFERAALLPRIPLISPPGPIGRNTTECMQSGIVHGAAAMTEGMVERFRAHLGSNAIVVATGGFISVIAAETRCIDHMDPYLTLRGIHLIQKRLRHEPSAAPHGESGGAQHPSPLPVSTVNAGRGVPPER